MEITVKVGEVTLTMTHPVEQDLSKQEVESRITQVMNREARRFSEIITVGLQDAETAVKEADRLRRLRSSGEKRGPNIILAAGTKDAKTGRIIEQQ